LMQAVASLQRKKPPAGTAQTRRGTLLPMVASQGTTIGGGCTTGGCSSCGHQERR
jgi:hypothetical protein